MDKDKQIDRMESELLSRQLCQILIECHRAYQEDVSNEGMTYDDFISEFFGAHGILPCSSGQMNGYKDVCKFFKEHQPIIEYRFKFSDFNEQDAQMMLREFEHCSSFFDRSLIDIQLKSIIPKLEKDDVSSRLSDCAKETALFYDTVDQIELIAILTGKSTKDHGIYNVSHFAYYMKKLEGQGMMIQHWQSMIWNLSRIVYKGRYLTQHLISSTVHNIAALKRRPWQYDAIDECMSDVIQKVRNRSC